MLTSRAKALELFPGHPDLLGMRAIACSRDRRRKQALAFSDGSIAAPRPTYWAWLARAEVFLAGSKAVVDGCISKAIAAAGQDLAIVRLQAGRLLRHRHAYPDAIQYLQAVVEQLPAAALAWYELGCCQHALGLAQAKASLQQALRINPHLVQAERLFRRIEKGFWSRIF